MHRQTSHRQRSPTDCCSRQLQRLNLLGQQRSPFLFDLEIVCLRHCRTAKNSDIARHVCYRRSLWPVGVVLGIVLALLGVSTTLAVYLGNLAISTHVPVRHLNA